MVTGEKRLCGNCLNSKDNADFPKEVWCNRLKMYVWRNSLGCSLHRLFGE